MASDAVHMAALPCLLQCSHTWSNHQPDGCLTLHLRESQSASKVVVQFERPGNPSLVACSKHRNMHAVLCLGWAGGQTFT